MVHKRFIIAAISLILILLLAFQLTSVLGHDEESFVDVEWASISLDYEQFRMDLGGRNYVLEEDVLTEEFHFLQQLQRKNPALEYPALFDVYYSLRIFFLEDSMDDNLF